jgi:hypothetical protein
MKKHIIILLVGFALTMSIVSCTKNEMARNFGGTEHITLKDNEVLVNMTWKEDDLWILTRDTLTDTDHFRESSSYGVWEGEVIVDKKK